MKKTTLFFLIPIVNCCLACSTDDPLLPELEEDVISSTYEEQKTETENSDEYLSDIMLADPYILKD